MKISWFFRYFDAVDQIQVFHSSDLKHSIITRHRFGIENDAIVIKT